MLISACTPLALQPLQEADAAVGALSSQGEVVADEHVDGDVGRAIQRNGEGRRYTLVRDFGGHGIGPPPAPKPPARAFLSSMTRQASVNR